MHGFTIDERDEIWRRWKAGESMRVIGRAVGAGQSSVQSVLQRCGGIRPASRRRSEQCLAMAEREEISRGLSAGLSFRRIAKQLGRAPSTVSREVHRNGGRSRYRATLADKAAWRRARRPKLCKLSKRRRLRTVVERKLRRRWSPQQISAWLKRRYDQPSMNVSHETIYRTLFIQARGALKKDLTAYLRSRRVMRRSKKGSTLKARGPIADAISIRERPAEVEDRAVPGHWEGDLLAGSNESYIVTLVERQTRFVMLGKIADRSSETVVAAVQRLIRKLPAQLRKSLTWDRGAEMAQHKQLTVATDVSVYFCDPRSPWQRGSNENTNGLLRQYFPKGQDVSVHSQRDLNKVAYELNGRPRMTLDWDTPAERLHQVLQ